MRIMIALLIFSSSFSYGQNGTDSLWGSKKFRFGITLQAGVAFWSQDNINAVLSQNNLPATKEKSTVVGIGDILQWNKFRATTLLLFGGNKNSANSENMEQRFGGGELNVEYAVIRKEGFSLSPMIGGGVMDGMITIRQHASSQSISNSFVNRNATELFNSQGFVNAALNVGFARAPGITAHLLQATVGYRYGFLSSNWSTDPNSEVLANSSTDALRQLYLSLKMNFLFAGKNR